MDHGISIYKQAVQAGKLSENDVRVQLKSKGQTIYYLLSNSMDKLVAEGKLDLAAQVVRQLLKHCPQNLHEFTDFQKWLAAKFTPASGMIWDEPGLSFRLVRRAGEEHGQTKDATIHDSLLFF